MVRILDIGLALVATGALTMAASMIETRRSNAIFAIGARAVVAGLVAMVYVAVKL
ncbi:MAG: hypothetical protein ACRDCE_00910 [Cetobacterium sp.]|uniref:hypothetical protein n=1 Tax=Cetobacterium sp. TaxID=2071632 RepID=UPI003EE5D105